MWLSGTSCSHVRDHCVACVPGEEGPPEVGPQGAAADQELCRIVKCTPAQLAPSSNCVDNYNSIPDVVYLIVTK